MAYEDLPFVAVSETSKVIDAWDLSQIPHDKSEVTGRDYFHRLYFEVLLLGQTNLIERTLSAMAAKHDEWGPVEKGFLKALGESLTD